MAQRVPPLLLPEGVLGKEYSSKLHMRISHSSHEDVRATVKVLAVQHLLNVIKVVDDDRRNVSDIEANDAGLVDFAEPKRALVKVFWIGEQKEEVTSHDWNPRRA